MQNDNADTSDAARLRKLALAQWDTEGGAGPGGPQEALHLPLTSSRKTPIKPKSK